MSKADAFYHWRNEKLGIFSLTSKEREDMCWTIKHYGIEECEKAYIIKNIITMPCPTTEIMNFSKEEIEFLESISK